MRGKLLAIVVLAALAIALVIWHGPRGSRRVSPVQTAEREARASALHPAASGPSVKTIAPASRPAIEILEDLDALVDQWREHAASQPATLPTGGDKTDGDVELQAATELLLARRYERAAVVFDRLLVRRPRDVRILVGKAAALVGLSRPDDALPLLENALLIEPENVPARFNHGVALIRAGQPQAAVAEFEAVLKRAPPHVEAEFNLAVLHQAAGRYHPAIALWRDLTPDLSTQPSKRPRLSSARLVEALSHRGEIALELHLSDEAEACFQRVLQLDPADARAWCNIGIARADAGRRAEAADALNRALQINAGLVPAINQLALVRAATYRDAGDEAARAEALRLCDRSLALEPHQPNVRSLRDALQNPPEPEETSKRSGGL